MAGQKAEKGDGGGAADVLPWDNVNSRFFTKVNIESTRWDQLFPYRLIVINSENNSIIGKGSGSTNITINKDLTRSAIEFTPINTQWIFTLPITPQQLTISDTFAINTTATLRGIVEEHSGVRFKMINVQGTMGVWNFRESVEKPPSPTILNSLFGGTIEAKDNVLNQFKKTVNSAISGHPASKPDTVRPEASKFGLNATGYYHAMALQQFLEQYAEAKKDPKNKHWRLVFDIPKQNQSFVVTPMLFNWAQSAQKPMEINYNMQLKAWRRVDLLAAKPSQGETVPTLSPLTLQKILNIISEARKTLSSITNLIGAVRSDINAPLEALRQTSLFVKDLAGAVITAADIPYQAQRDYAYAVNDFLKSLSSSEILRNAATDPAIAAALKDLRIGWDRSEGVSAGSIRSGQLGPGAVNAQKTDPGMSLLDKPEQNHTLMDKINISALSLNDDQLGLIADAVADARRITVNDLKKYREIIQQLSLQLSNNFGAGNTFYSKVYSAPTPAKRIQGMTLDEYDILQSLYDVMQAYDILTATSQLDDQKKLSNMDYVAGLAEEAGATFNNTQAKILAPVPFGLTVEAIAARYLGNPQRWLEIVTLNNLRSPYIDENGFKLSLLSNASGRQATVAVIENIYVGQRVLLRSSSQSETARKILNIDKLSSTSYLLSFDGEANLDNFTKNDSAYIQAYLPGTVNSQQKIFIPTDFAVANDPKITNPSSTQGDPLVGLSKVDWLLTETGDLAVNSYGDLRLAAGITNLIQALKIKIGTQKGKVLNHPNFGLGVKAGQMTSDTDVKAIFQDINSLIKQDSRFQGLDTLQVTINGPTMTINMGVRLAGNNGVFPVAFDIAN